jgi:hypothetical protein
LAFPFFYMALGAGFGRAGSSSSLLDPTSRLTAAFFFFFGVDKSLRFFSSFFLCSSAALKSWRRAEQLRFYETRVE